ncbi:cyclase family protein [Methanoregula sp.]|uniref:cyclase family protein n=1 Tax=Methanoregula sp. TaxID=2052170 RepID=UPI000CB54E2E|nr:cyclase family protein [Methanoregula sp.]PKG32894.1 MAG: cyclase [Methanoregula sp.]
MLKRISYPLTPQSPLYPGTPEITRAEGKSIGRGDSANTSILTLSSHAGSHIDAPLHFCTEGRTTREILKDRLTISPVYCIDLPVKPATGIRIRDLEPYTRQIAGTKGLLIRTGMHRLRASDLGRYCNDHPWIHPEVPAFLRTTCPSLILLGIDTISISNPQFRSEGRQCHRAFLCHDNPILLAEDLDLSDSELSDVGFSVLIYPWIVDDLDGVPILAFAEIP